MGTNVQLRYFSSHAHLEHFVSCSTSYPWLGGKSQSPTRDTCLVWQFIENFTGEAIKFLSLKCRRRRSKRGRRRRGKKYRTKWYIMGQSAPNEALTAALEERQQRCRDRVPNLSPLAPPAAPMASRYKFELSDVPKKLVKYLAPNCSSAQMLPPPKVADIRSTAVRISLQVSVYVMWTP